MGKTSRIAPGAARHDAGNRVQEYPTSIVARLSLLFHCVNRSSYPETDSLSTYLRQSRRDLRGARDVYEKLLAHLQTQEGSSRLDPDAVQYLCNILNDFPSTLRKYTRTVSAEGSFKLSDDYDDTRLLLLYDGEKVVHRRAAFGLVDVDTVTHESYKADTYIRHLLRTALVRSEREEAIVTLQRGDAKRCLAVMQALLDSESEWASFKNLAPPGDLGPYGGKHYMRVRKLLIKLAAVSGHVPPSIDLPGIVAEKSSSTFDGGYSEVYRGSYQGRTVALKRVRANVSGEGTQILYDIALTLRTLRHRAILPLLGIDQDNFKESEARTCIVTPWLDRGSIRQHISSLQEKRQEVPLGSICCQIVDGLQYLHSQHIVHGDLRGANVFIGEDGGVLLGNFGMYEFTRTIPDGPIGQHPGTNCALWMAPELHAPQFITPDSQGSAISLREPGPTPASDVYSFGCVCVELYSGVDPRFEGIAERGRTVAFQISSAVIAGKRPIRPSANGASGIPIPDTMWTIVQQCWNQSPALRPDSRTLLATLHSL